MTVRESLKVTAIHGQTSDHRHIDAGIIWQAERMLYLKVGEYEMCIPLADAAAMMQIVQTLLNNA